VPSWGMQKRGFTKSEAESSIRTANQEEGGCRTVWDVVCGITAFARGIQHADSRVVMERKAGKLMKEITGTGEE